MILAHTAVPSVVHFELFGLRGEPQALLQRQLSHLLGLLGGGFGIGITHLHLHLEFGLRLQPIIVDVLLTTILGVAPLPHHKHLQVEVLVLHQEVRQCLRSIEGHSTVVALVGIAERTILLIALVALEVQVPDLELRWHTTIILDPRCPPSRPFQCPLPRSWCAVPPDPRTTTTVPSVSGTTSCGCPCPYCHD